MQNYVLTADQIIVRLIAAVVLGGIIGFEREYKSHPAGLKTHILVCVGSAMIALIQEEITWQALHFATEYPDFVGVIRSDQARLVAQVISGIGFLGAGTIILSKGAVRGLTTAASVWAVAALGIAIGMGYYRIATFSFFWRSWSL
ncbi:MgtC/SapB family protein [Enterococcus hirae]|nr:MgtC/SapB family protein [Enterococcus hirae]